MNWMKNMLARKSHAIASDNTSADTMNATTSNAAVREICRRHE